ncbi:MAG: sulfatase [Chitinophagaceae bacterium BSSC1]|nr:MAG: sulfatase [Chitinophagaceae bacterium BSSC1]
MLLLLWIPVSSLGQSKPNIILFLVDDMGWQDCSVPFDQTKSPLNQRYHTPNMEKLASQGMKFINAYATPVCTPTRTSILTGMNAAHHGVTNWTSPQRNNNSDNPDTQLQAVDWNINGLSPVPNIPKTVYATPFPKLLADAGYHTIHVGKAHWASMGTPGANPHNMGFQVNIAGHAAGHPQSYLGKDNYGNLPGKTSAQAVPDLEEYFGTDSFLTEALTLEAIKALEQSVKNHQPFFLNMAHYAVHAPIMADKRFVQKYYDQGLDSIEARYASLVEGMDKSLGDIMHWLDQKGIASNTIIMFISDNGGLSLKPQRGGEAHTQNLPLRAGKGSVYEGGIRIPMLVKWPGKVRANSIAKQYVMVEDFFPSILAMAGIKNPKLVQTIDGKSFLSILNNPSLQDSTRSLVWHYPNKWIPNDGPGINYFSAIRQGNWKLVYNQRNGKKELYQLSTDLGELHDLSSQYPDMVNALSKTLSVQLRQWKAHMPIVINTGKLLPFPDEL